MNLLTLQTRGLVHHRRMHLALALCAVVGSATLTGALIVGDSVRGSLRDHALRRLGPVTFAMQSGRYVRQALSDGPHRCGALLLRGGVDHATSGARAGSVQMVGVDDRFQELWGPAFGDATSVVPRSGPDGGDAPRGVALNESLAHELGAKVGDEVLLRMARASRVPSESLLGRPDEVSTSLRMNVRAIVADDGVGGFSLEASPTSPFTVFVPLADMQRAVGRPGRINTILVGDVAAVGNLIDHKRDGHSTPARRLDDELAARIQLSDYDVRLRRDDSRGYLSLESEGILLEPAVERAAISAARRLRRRAMPVLSYLANRIERLDADGTVAGSTPYSIVAAVDGTAFGTSELAGDAANDDTTHRALSAIALNSWTVDDLGAKVGDRIRLTYYVSGRVGELTTQSHDFRLSVVTPDSEAVNDPGFLPPYRGITDAPTLAGWNPPSQFRIDLKAIRPRDEAYWKERRGAPKAFIGLHTGQELWAGEDARFGRLTALRLYADGDDPERTGASFTSAFLEALRPAEMGLTFTDVRAGAETAAEGSSDFGMLFVSFSFFLIASAMLLVALVFRLNLETRAGEIGLLLSLGYTRRLVMRLFLIEGAIVAAAGVGVGLLPAAGYAWLMLAGLRTWWNAAAGVSFLTLHVKGGSLATGFAAGFFVSLLSLRWALRGVFRSSPRALLAGDVQAEAGSRSVAGSRRALWILIGSLAVGIVAILFSHGARGELNVAGFFAGGAALLIAGLAAIAVGIGRKRRGIIHRGGVGAMVRLGLRNALRKRGRTLTTAGIIASSGFIIIVVGASGHGADAGALARTGGTGGYTLLAECSVPLPYDPSGDAGLEELGVSDETRSLLRGATIIPMRLKPGDDASCLNLYRVRQPRILGAPPAFIERGGFTFDRTIELLPAERENSWRLLDRTLEDGAVPAVGDANTLQWLLKLGVGDDLAVTDDEGAERRLRIVGMLSGSILQGELVISEAGFKRIFARTAGVGLILADTPPDRSSAVSAGLERDLSRYGLDAMSTLERLDRYLAAERTYMSAFQTLGGVGLMLGVCGLGAIMLRNSLERRGEFALMQALGLSRARLGLMVLSESTAVLLAGLLIGTAAAFTAVWPHLARHAGEIEWRSLALTLFGVLAAGMAACVGAMRLVVRIPVLQSLRRE